MDDLNCKHCGTLVEGKFCSECGQRYLTTPYSKEIVLFIISQTIDFGANYFKTLWTLFIKPNKVISTFLSGDVKRYVNPLKYLVLTVALMIVLDWSEAYLTDDPDGESEGMELEIYGLLALAILYIIVIYKLFWQSYKWVEHFIISIYLAIQMLMITTIVFSLLSLIFNSVIIESNDIDWIGYSFIVMGIYYFHFNISVFKNRKFLTFIKSILILMIGFVILMIGFIIFNYDSL